MEGGGIDVERWSHINKLLSREGPLQGAGFEVDTKEERGNLSYLRDEHKLLIVGAGGLGCDLLKCITLSGFKDIHCIDMDTIDPSNLNRQFLFRENDVGKAKSVCASAFINKRVLGAKVTGHLGKIQDDKIGEWDNTSFYRQFQLVICGLDSVDARLWINAKLHAMLDFYEDEEGNPEVDLETLIPLIDSGTEGFKGNIRVILPGMTSCTQCTASMFPPKAATPICTLAGKPRNATHCIEWAGLIHWDDAAPFKDENGEVIKYDTDKKEHMQWITDKAIARAEECGITEHIDYKKTLGVIKSIIPAIASTNGIAAAAACNEAFKFATESTSYLKNYMLYTGEQGIFTNAQELLKSPDCIVCSGKTFTVSVNPLQTLQQLLHELKEDERFKLGKADPTVMHSDAPLYMPTGPAFLVNSTKKNYTDECRNLFADEDVISVLGQNLAGVSITIKVKFDDNHEIPKLPEPEEN